MLDLRAPIVPGKSAAGVMLGQSAQEIRVTPKAVSTLDGGEFLEFDSVFLWVVDGLVDRICVSGVYGGLIGDTVGIGSTLQQAQDSLGPVIEDESDNLVVVGLPGLSLETEAWKGPRGREMVGENLTARITEI